MKKSISVILVMIMALFALGNVSAQPEIMQGTTENIRTASPASTNNSFYLGSDFHAIIYGDSKVKCNGREYRFADQQLVCETNGKTECILSADGDNLNISNGKLYYSVYENGIASAVSFDLTSGKQRELFCLGSDRIANMYVINDSMLELLAGNQVVRYNINTGSIDTLDAPKESFSFIPTEYGNLYATGSSVDSTIVFMGKALVKHATYYSVENGSFIATIDGTTYQMPLTEIVARCETAENRVKLSEICPLQDMNEYDFYGEYRISDIINLEADDCYECEEEAKTPSIETLIESSREITVTGTPITPNTRQQTIINRATEVVNTDWTPQVSFAGWHSTLGNYDADYTQYETYTGLPYSRPGHFSSTSFTQVYIGFNNFSDGVLSSLDGFEDRVEETSDPFNQAAFTTTPNIQYGGYGALYGMDCSRFVCYAWGYGTGEDHATGGYSSDTKCQKLTSKGNGAFLTANDLAMLVPGDAFVKSGSHAILVTAVYKDSSGTVTRVEIMEETPPKARKLIYSNEYSYPYNINYLLGKKLAPDPGSTPYQIYRLKEYLTLLASPGTVSPNKIHIITGKTYGFFNNGVLPTPIRSNYRFDGWFTKASGGVQVTANTVVDNSGARKLYAHWTYAPTRNNSRMVNQVDRK